MIRATGMDSPADDESLPPQLREALAIMGKRGRVVELTAVLSTSAPTPEYGAPDLLISSARPPDVPARGPQSVRGVDGSKEGA